MPHRTGRRSALEGWQLPGHTLHLVLKAHETGRGVRRRDLLLVRVGQRRRGSGKCGPDRVGGLCKVRLRHRATAQRQQDSQELHAAAAEGCSPRPTCAGDPLARTDSLRRGHAPHRASASSPCALTCLLRWRLVTPPWPPTIHTCTCIRIQHIVCHEPCTACPGKAAVGSTSRRTWRIHAVYYMLSRRRCERGKQASMTTRDESTVTQMRCAHGGLVEEFNPWEGPYVDDPYPFFARARAEEPVFYSPLIDMWLVSGYDDIWAVLRDPARFSAANALSPVSPFTPEAQQILIDGGYTLQPALTNNDPPGHTRVRSHINKVFSARRIAALEPRIRQFADTRIDAFVDDGHADLIRQFAYPLPILVVFSLIGIPQEDMEQVKAWCSNRVQFVFGKLSPEQQIDCARNMVAFWHYTRAF